MASKTLMKLEFSVYRENEMAWFWLYDETANDVDRRNDI